MALYGDLYRQAVRLRDAIIAVVTGNERTLTDEAYSASRRALLSDEWLQQFTPNLLENCHSISDLLAYGKSVSPSYAGRRDAIRVDFQSVIRALDEQSRTEAAMPAEKALPAREVAAASLSAFLSYQTADKAAARVIKDYLERLGIPAFLAHEDIEVSQEWQVRIFKELRQASLFVCVLSENYLKSIYCMQEVGIAVYRAGDLVVVPLSIDGKTVSPGFMQHIQSKVVQVERLNFETFYSPIKRSNKTLAYRCAIRYIAHSGGYRDAEARFAILMPDVADLTADLVGELLDACIDNSQVCEASGCAKNYIPTVLKMHPNAGNTSVRQKLTVICKRFGASL